MNSRSNNQGRTSNASAIVELSLKFDIQFLGGYPLTLLQSIVCENKKEENYEYLKI